MVELHVRMKQLHGMDHGKPVSLAPAVDHTADVRGRRATAQLYARGRRALLTQSAVSHQIGALERHLGARLFSRLNPGIELTAEGRVLLEGARAGLDSILLATDRV